MLNWKEFEVQEQIRKDRLVRAEHARLVRFVSTQQESSLKKVSIQILKMVGSRLVRWGDSLLNRCAKLSLVSQGQSSQSNL